MKLRMSKCSGNIFNCSFFSTITVVYGLVFCHYTINVFELTTKYFPVMNYRRLCWDMSKSELVDLWWTVCWNTSTIFHPCDCDIVICSRLCHFSWHYWLFNLILCCFGEWAKGWWWSGDIFNLKTKLEVWSSHFVANVSLKSSAGSNCLPQLNTVTRD